MKSLFYSLLLVLFTSSLHGQFKKGDVEFSFMATIDKHSERTENYPFNVSIDPVTVFYLSLNPGYYIIDGLSVEPEFSIFANSNSKPATSLIGNVSYTYKAESSPLAVYARAGYGFSNGYYYPAVRGAAYRISSRFDVGILNAGVGVKFLFGTSAVIRAEVNYKEQSSEQEYYAYSASNPYGTKKKYDQILEDITLMVGCGLLF